MKKDNLWETFIWIIIWMFILTFIVLWIINIISYNKDLVNDYSKLTNINILNKNTFNILNKLDLQTIEEWEEFFLYKNTSTNTFDLFTWSINLSYQYIDIQWNKINDITNYIDYYYSRVIKLDKKWAWNMIWINSYDIKIKELMNSN